MKKFLAILLSVMMLSSLFTACGKSGTTTDTTASKTSEATTSGTTTTEVAKDDLSKSYDITWLGLPFNPGAQTGEYVQTVVEKKFNVKITPIFLDGEGYKTKKPVMLSSGQIPDILIEMDPANLLNDASQGFLAELPYDTIQKYAPKMNELVTGYAPGAWLYSYYKEKNYGIPTVYPGGNMSVPGVWRMDLLKSVGITKVPETLTEIHDAFAKLVKEKKVKYGMTSEMKAWWTAFPEFFGAYGILPFNWVEADGKVAWGGTLPQTKQALEMLRNWYKEGLIDPEFVLDDSPNDKKKFTNGITAYQQGQSNFSSFEPSNATSFQNAEAPIKKIIPTAEVVPGVLPKGPDGKQGVFRWGPAGNIISFGKQVAKDQGKLLRLLNIIESELTDENLYIETKFGQKGTMWDLVDAAAGASGGIKQLPPYNDYNEAVKHAVGNNLGASTFFSFPVSPDILKKYMPKVQSDFIEKYNSSKYVMTDVFFKPDAVPSAKTYIANLQSMQLTAFAQIIRGEKELSYFDEFVTQWNAQGGQQMTTDANALYKTRQDVLKQVGAK